MLISVVIPAYNCINSLEATLESILLSGLTDFEILLIDDGSKDGTAQLCDVLAGRHGCVRCVHRENGGVSAARNRGIQEAQGSYILFFDADDTVDPGTLACCQEILAAQRPDMLIFGMSFDYYFHGKLYRRDELTAPMSGLLPRAEWIGKMRQLYDCNALSPVWNKLIRRELLVEHQILFPGGMIEMEDFLFSLRCLKHCGNIYLLPQAIYRYRQPEDESNTYRRLCRIPSLSAYMVPFEEELAAVADGREIAADIYKSFFYQMIRFGNIPLIERTAKDMLSGKYAEQIATEDPELHRLLTEGKYASVRNNRRVRRLRHWLAVRVKYLKNGRKIK